MDKNTRKRKGFIPGCLAFIVIVAIIIGMFLWWMKYQVKSFVLQFTDTSPLTISSLNITKEEIEQSVDKIEQFAKLAKKSEDPIKLELNSREINTLIARIPIFVKRNLNDIKNQSNKLANLSAEQKQEIIKTWEELPQMIRVEIHGDRIKGKISIPLNRRFLPNPSEFFSILGVNGDRYFTARTSFNISVENEKPSIDIDYIEIKGEPIPEDLLAAIKERFENNEELKKQNQVENAIKITELKVTNGHLILSGIANKK